jgi:hypothetical protein
LDRSPGELGGFHALMYAFDGEEIWNFWKRELGEMKRGVCDPIVVFSALDGLEISRVLVRFSWNPIASWICAIWRAYCSDGGDEKPRWSYIFRGCI